MRNLRDAPDVTRRNDVGLHGLDVASLAITKLPGHFRLQQAVGAGGAAADVALWNIEHGEAGISQQARRVLDHWGEADWDLPLVAEVRARLAD
jgi:hypothetical protein